jgi:flagellar secretion chaperone FliS
MSNPYQRYKQTAILSASKEQIMLMLYEGAIRFTKVAIQATQDKNIPERGKNILKAYDIVLEFQASLNHNVAGDLPKQLDQLYAYMLEQYTKANMTGNLEALQSCLKVLENLYDGWNQVINKTKNESDQNGGAA